MQFIYRLVISLFHSAIRIAALAGNTKASAWVAGRRDWRSKLDRFRAQRSEVPLIWMHCASLGEFEQGRPVLEYLRREHPHHLIAVTFYSPSGYEKRREYSGADWVGYLPPDGPRNARQWLVTLRPSLAIFVKYEFWHFHLQALREKGIATALIAGSFQPEQVFFKPYGRFFRRMLRRFDLLAVQTPADRDLLEELHLPGRIVVTGDPRADRTLAITQEPFSDPTIETFAAGARLFIAGSTWPADERLLVQLLAQLPAGWKLLIAPHEVAVARIEELKSAFAEPMVSYTEQPNSPQLHNARVLLLDTVGILNKVYRYGRMVYIGGGFGISIHNTLEPMAYGLPVIFGPRYKKFPEAIAAVAKGAAFSIQSESDLFATATRLSDEREYAQAHEAVRELMESAAGAAARTNQAIDTLLPPPRAPD